MTENVIWQPNKVSAKDRYRVLGQKGLVVWFTGLSGSGKSTLLRCATFLEQIDGGDITYSGKTVVKEGIYPGKKELWEAGQQFGLVSSKPEMWDWCSSSLICSLIFP